MIFINIFITNDRISFKKIIGIRNSTPPLSSGLAQHNKKYFSDPQSSLPYLIMKICLRESLIQIFLLKDMPSKPIIIISKELTKSRRYTQPHTSTLSSKIYFLKLQTIPIFRNPPPQTQVGFPTTTSTPSTNYSPQHYPSTFIPLRSKTYISQDGMDSTPNLLPSNHLFMDTHIQNPHSSSSTNSLRVLWHLGQCY